jgi:hypothetical protein
LDEPAAAALLPLALVADSIVLAASAGSREDEADYVETDPVPEETVAAAPQCGGPATCPEYHARICEGPVGQCTCRCEQGYQQPRCIDGKLVAQSGGKLVMYSSPSCQ